MKSTPIVLSVTSHPKNLRHIRRLIAEVTLETGFSKKDSTNIILAVDEACSNIIKHSYKNDPNRKIDLTVRQDSDFLTISVVDDGVKFDIHSIKVRKINEIRPGGLGLYIIQQVMDTVEYSRTPEGFNKIKMAKRLVTR